MGTGGGLTTGSIETGTKGLGLSKGVYDPICRDRDKRVGVIKGVYDRISRDRDRRVGVIKKGFSRVWVKKYNNYSSCSSPIGLRNQATRWHRRRERDLLLLRSEVMQS